MLASILQEAGYKVGLYTSPHLKNFTERIRINGREIPKRKVSSFINKQKAFLERQKLSFFEMTVGLAFDYFANRKSGYCYYRSWTGRKIGFYQYYYSRSCCNYKYRIRSYTIFREKHCLKLLMKKQEL